ncbi:PAS domain-containing protein [Pseudemcibacter aquimaris]|uniref:PAS domain-containing protein n=1 Tax=Pseudemcibacter aquimaris TaxID=2857064 RepID=UPI00201208B5|nr:PAS domain-containing protein [Pseudemcibacter aquimaris]MCC3861065.1 PAS domain-containing protein [Pseudemcibacter aquimaris]WDU59883.1 PAS domain-containing protein [Pseudemcibacter aquimaris]
MPKNNVKPTGIENTFSENEIIVSKTDLKGEITYVNDVFCKLAEAKESEMIGQPHNVIRHPDMPRTIFHFLWQQIKSKNEIFAYVKNMAMSGNHYWVFAHVTPTLDGSGNIVGFHSSRRAAPKAEIDFIDSLYKKIKDVEEGSSNRKDGLEAGVAFVNDYLANEGLTYDEFVWSVSGNR